MSVRPSRSKSIPNPLVRTDIPIFPIAYAVFPLKNREYIGGLTTMIRPFQSFFSLKIGRTAWIVPYKPSFSGQCLSEKGALLDTCCTLWVDTLHQLKALHGRFLYGAPPDCSTVVDAHINPPVYVERLIDHPLYARKVSCINWDGAGISARFAYFPFDGVDGRLRGIWVWRERMNL